MIEPLVSIGVPVFNADRFVAESLDSLLAQTYPNLEILISDNASTDGTAAICRNYAEKDRRISYHRHDKNAGAVRNFNSIVPRSKGEFFCWSADHDLRSPTYISRCVEILRADPNVVLVHSQTTLVDMTGKFLEVMSDRIDTRGCIDPVKRYAAVIGQLYNCNIVYGVMRSSTLKASGLFRNVYGGDHVLLGDMAIRGTFVHIPEPLFFRRQNRATELDAAAAAKRMMETMDPENAKRKSGHDQGALFRELRAAQVSTVMHAPISWRQRLVAALETFRTYKERYGLHYPADGAISDLAARILSFAPVRSYRERSRKAAKARESELRLRTAQRINLGASWTIVPGWAGTDIETLNVLTREDFSKRWPTASRDAFLAEHVWEHLDETQGRTAIAHCFEFLKPGGRLRIAVPDRLHPDPTYVEHVRPGGTGPGANDHKTFYDYRLLSRLLSEVGFQVQLLEYWDEHGQFHAGDWSPTDGEIRRSSKTDPRNRDGQLRYTSLIVDGIRPLVAPPALVTEARSSDALLH